MRNFYLEQHNNLMKLNKRILDNYDRENEQKNPIPEVPLPPPEKKLKVSYHEQMRKLLKLGRYYVGQLNP